MQFTTLTLSALSIGSALAASSSTDSGTASTTSSAANGKATDKGGNGSGSGSGMVKVHVVKVGATNGSLAYFPNTITAAVGEMVQFQFAPANHTVTQSTFDAPCQPISMHSNITGIYSGFMPVSASSQTIPTYTILINNTTPMWLYCSQGKHCQNGMTMVINENTKANASRTLENYQAAAAKATVNLPGTAVADGTSGTVAGSGSSDSGSSSSGSSSSGYSSSGSGTTNANSTSTGSGSKSTSSGSSAAKVVKASEALSLAALVAAGIALFV